MKMYASYFFQNQKAMCLIFTLSMLQVCYFSKDILWPDTIVISFIWSLTC